MRRTLISNPMDGGAAEHAISSKGRKEPKQNAQRYNCIYCDPPWRFQNWSMSELAIRGEKWARRNGRSPYPVLDHADICALPIKDLAAKDCVLMMWATYPKLNEAIEVIKAWSFTFKTVAFTWVKLNPTGRVEQQGRDVICRNGFKFGLGYWTRGNCEICLLATRGHPKRVSKCVPQLVLEPVGEHSAKPPIVRTKIEQLLGDVPRIELFARETAPGWMSLGDSLDNQDIRVALPNHISTLGL